VVNKILEQGRFLKKNNKTGCYEVLDRKAAVRKARQALLDWKPKRRPVNLLVNSSMQEKLEGFPDLPSIDKIKKEHGHLKKEFAILDEELDDAIASYKLLHPSSKEDDGEGDKRISSFLDNLLNTDMDLETTFDQALKEPREESRILTRNGNMNNNTKCEGNRKPVKKDSANFETVLNVVKVAAKSVKRRFISRRLHRILVENENARLRRQIMSMQLMKKAMIASHIAHVNA